MQPYFFMKLQAPALNMQGVFELGSAAVLTMRYDGKNGPLA